MRYILLAALSAATLAVAPAGAAAPEKASVKKEEGVKMQKHPNVQLIERYYAAYGRGDIAYLKANIFAPDIKWIIPGHHPLAKTYHGVDEVVGFFEALKKGGFKAETYFLEANDNYVVDMHRGWGEARGHKVDQRWCLVFKIKDGKIIEAQNFPGDQHEADAFFNAVYR